MDEPETTTQPMTGPAGPPAADGAGSPEPHPQRLLEPSPRFTDSYGLVLVMLIASYFASAFSGNGDYASAAALCILAITTWLALRASAVHRTLLRITLALIPVVTVLAVVMTLVGDSASTDWVVKAFTGLLVIVAPAAIIKRLTSHLVVSANTFYGAVSVYLLLGMFFATAYAIIAKVGGSPFFFQIDTATSVDYLYFSLVTMATVGYGDLTAAGDVGRITAAIEAVIGQLYLITVVALVVQNLGSERRGRHRTDD